MRRVLLPLRIADAAPPADGVLLDFAGHTMGTSWSVRLVAGGAEQGAEHGLHAELQQQLDAVVAQMSHWEAGSNLGRFNRAPAGSWHALPAAFFDVLSFALEVSHESGRAYDPCAGALVNLWGFGPHGRFADPDFAPPSPAQVAQVMQERAEQQIELDPARRRALQPGGTQLDFSAVAKGYAVDRLAFHLRARGCSHFLVEVGGELRGEGVKPDGQPWWVRLENVSSDTDQLVLALHGLSVATSGDYRRYFTQDGQRYAHTIDPRSGAPIDNGVASVTVLHPQCMAADAWSTALTVLGHHDGMALAERLGLAVRFMVRAADGFSEYMSTPFQKMLSDDLDD